jgi:hypothetical protein
LPLIVGIEKKTFIRLLKFVIKSGASVKYDVLKEGSENS